MKYLKTFEKFNQLKYKISDYVILKNIEDYFITPFKCTKIINIEENFLYVVKAISMDDDEKKIFNDEYIKKYEVFNFQQQDKDIERLATQEEINEYNLLLQANKYNL